MTKQQIVFHEDEEEENNKLEKEQQEIVKAEDKQNLIAAVNKSKEPLLKISTVFPFDLFPSSLVIDEDRVNIIIKGFIGSESIHLVMIENIDDVNIQTSLLFATISIIDKNLPVDKYTIKYLKKQEALKARRIIGGLMIAKQRNLDISSVDTPELIKMMEELGSIA